MQKVPNRILQDWQQVDKKEIENYYKIREELSVSSGGVLRGNRVVNRLQEDIKL